MSKRSKDDRRLIKEQNDKIEKMQRLANPLDTVEFVQFLRTKSSRILFFNEYKNEIGYAVANPNHKLWRMGEEPNGRTLVAWYRFLQFSGADVKDYSGFNNNGNVFQGNPARSTAHTDYQGSCAFNGQNTTLSIPHSDTLSLVGLNVGFYVSAWVYPTALELHGGKPRVIACKVDDDPENPGRGWALWVTPNGTLTFSVLMGGNAYSRAATGALSRVNRWYLVGAGFSAAGNAVQPLVVNTQSYTSDAQINNTVRPILPTAETDVNLDLLIGSSGDGTSSYFAGRIADFRWWRNRIITTTEHSNYYTNKHSVSPIDHVAMVGVATLAYETGGGTGGTPPPAPTPISKYSFSPISFSPRSFTVNQNETGENAPGGGGGSSPLIPGQFIDTFQDQTYTLSSLNQVSPNLKWKLVILPGGSGTTAGFARVEDYTHPGLTAQRLLRMKRGASPGPTVESNQYKFQDVWMRCRVRTISQLAAGDNNYARMMFKYVGENDNYSVLVRPTGVRLLKTEGSATTQVVLAEQSNPSGEVLHPVGVSRLVTVQTQRDGGLIYVSVDGTNVITYNRPNPDDNIITALAPVALRASGSEATFDDVLVRPIFGDAFQGLIYTLTSVGQKSINNRWELITAPAGSGSVGTFDSFDYNQGGRVLRINSGSTGGATVPLVLSTVSYKSVFMSCMMANVARHVVDNFNGGYLIVKWKDANNYYALTHYPTGWSLIRRLNGVTTTVADETGLNYSENTWRQMSFYSANEAKHIEVYIAGQLRYSEIDQTNGVASGDGGLLAGVGRIGMMAQRSNTIWDNIVARAAGNTID